MILDPFLQLIISVLNLYGWVIIIRLVIGWLIYFEVINKYNKFVQQVNHVAFKLTEPVMAPIRRVLPDLSGIDISPIVVFLLIQFITNSIISYAHSF